MDWYFSSALLIGTVLFLMALGLPVAFAFITVNLIGAYVFMGGLIGVTQLVDNITSLITTFELIAIPLFILMGSLFFHTGLAIKVFDTLDICLGRLPGRLCYLSIAGGTLFSTLVGSSLANTAMLGSILVPEMMRRGYSLQMTLGPILGTGGLAIIIPPSALTVLLGSIAQVDVGKLLIAGLLPGLLLAILYALVILIKVRVNPDSAPSYAIERIATGEIIKLLLKNVVTVGVVIFCVVGFIVLGIATPSESAAFGVLGIVLLATMFGKLSRSAIKESVKSAARISGMTFLIIVGSTGFSQLMSFSGASSGVIRVMTSGELNPYIMLLIMFMILLVLGAVMDALSIMLLTVPVFFPLAQTLGFDLVWFGIIMLMAIEMSLTTPPFGLLLYIMMGVAPDGTKFSDVVLAAGPYLICDMLVVLSLVALPGIALFLPGLME